MMFAVDSMLGKLARWLRILGYDTLYEPSLPFAELANRAGVEKRTLLARRRYLPEGVLAANLFVVESDLFAEQLRSVVREYRLDIEGGIFTRCLACNVIVEPATRDEVKRTVPPKTWEGFDEFFKCPKCHSVFWGGAHRRNTLRRLKSIMQEQS